MVQALNRPGGHALGNDVNAAVLAYKIMSAPWPHSIPRWPSSVASTFQANLEPTDSTVYVASMAQT